MVSNLALFCLTTYLATFKKIRQFVPNLQHFFNNLKDAIAYVPSLFNLL